MRTILLAVALSTPCLFAAAIVDQSVLPGTIGAWRVSDHSGGYGASAAQVVTAGSTGQLSRVDLPIFNYSGAPGTFTLEIWSVVAGKPVEPPTTPLASASLSAAALTGFPSGTGSWASFDISSANVQVTSGDQFALVLKAAYTTDDLEAYWLSATSDVYAGGAGYARGRNSLTATDYTTWTDDFTAESGSGPWPWDFYFQTYVDSNVQAAPEPATGAMMGVLLFAAVARFHRNRARR